MNIVIITQDDPFYLGQNIRYLIENCPKPSKIVAAVVFEVSPFGKKETFLQKAQRTYKIFGASFFLHYTRKFLLSKVSSARDIKAILATHNIPLLKIAGNINSRESLEKIAEHRPDLIISIAGNQIFKKPLINLAPKGCLNLHTALLPKYRGLMPTFWVMKNNEEYTGVSVFFVDEGIDSGPILVQKRVEIGDKTQERLIEETKRIGMECIIEAIEKIQANTVDTIPNNNESATYYSFPTRSDVVDFLRGGKRFY